MYDAEIQLWRAVRNVGDLAYSPGSCFESGNQTVQDFADTIRPCRLVVLGCGQVFGDPQKWRGQPGRVDAPPETLAKACRRNLALDEKVCNLICAELFRRPDASLSARPVPPGTRPERRMFPFM